jgi:16S rRNA (cytosine1402-N4)-methyltransferase
MSNFHTPVLLEEVIDSLNIKKDHWYVDCNLGGGGHTQAILDKGGKVLAFEIDPAAIDHVSEKIQSNRLVIVQENFTKLQEIVQKYQIRPSGILFDLGVSSYQFDTSPKGFSFQRNEQLDMRMDPRLGIKASDFINALNESELARLFKEYGEEPFAKKIAHAITIHRKVRPIHTTQELVDIVLTVKRRMGRINPATQIFQALRIAVNDELNNIQIALSQAVEVLNKDGRLVVISFHSLEDRIIKDFFNQKSDAQDIMILTKKPVVADKIEVENNPRARSAKLRVAQKL